VPLLESANHVACNRHKHDAPPRKNRRPAVARLKVSRQCQVRPGIGADASRGHKAGGSWRRVGMETAGQACDGVRCCRRRCNSRAPKMPRSLVAGVPSAVTANCSNSSGNRPPRPQQGSDNRTPAAAAAAQLAAAAKQQQQLPQQQGSVNSRSHTFTFESRAASPRDEPYAGGSAVCAGGHTAAPASAAPVPYTPPRQQARPVSNLSTQPLQRDEKPDTPVRWARRLASGAPAAVVECLLCPSAACGRWVLNYLSTTRLSLKTKEVALTQGPRGRPGSACRVRRGGNPPAHTSS
jgi:hypothetical protein